MLDEEVQGGKTHATKHGVLRLQRLLEGLDLPQRPALVRGDHAFGNETAMAQMNQLYLFKLRQTAGVRRLVQRQWEREDWREVGAGFQAVEAELRLTGWSRARHVVMLRRGVKDSVIAKHAASSPGEQQQLHFANLRDATLWEYALLITNSDYALKSIAQLYRDRADCENGLDELKNQWAWGGYTTQDLERCNLSARAVWRSSTTGGAGMCGLPIRKRAKKPSPRARCWCA